MKMEGTAEVQVIFTVHHPERDGVVEASVSTETWDVAEGLPVHEAARCRDAVKQLLQAMVNMGGYCPIIPVNDGLSAGDALDSIAQMLSGKEWNVGMLDHIAELVRSTNRRVEDVAPEVPL